MAIITRPPSVLVDADSSQWNRETYPKEVPMTTALFRSGSPIGEALLYLVTSREDLDDLSVLSVGCSDGAEIDSFLALYNKLGLRGKVSAIGVDLSADAIEKAKEAVHFIPVFGDAKNLEGEIKKAVTLLQDFGIEVDDKAIIDVPDLNHPNGYFRVDTEQVREGHSVTFKQADLRTDTIEETDFDLIFINNVLYHLRPKDANAVIDNSTQMLGELGILGVGGHVDRMRYKLVDNPPPERSRMSYAFWLLGLTERMKRQGIEPVLSSTSSKLPTLFEKQELHF